MSLYDDIDTDKASGASGWASGIKLMHNQLAFKKATITAVSHSATHLGLCPSLFFFVVCMSVILFLYLCFFVSFLFT